MVVSIKRKPNKCWFSTCVEMDKNLVFFPALSNFKNMVSVVLLNYIFKLCVLLYILCSR